MVDKSRPNSLSGHRKSAAGVSEGQKVNHMQHEALCSLFRVRASGDNIMIQEPPLKMEEQTRRLVPRSSGGGSSSSLPMIGNLLRAD